MAHNYVLIALNLSLVSSLGFFFQQLPPTTITTHPFTVFLCFFGIIALAMLTTNFTETMVLQLLMYCRSDTATELC
jgi:hypothetical protein